MNVTIDVTVNGESHRLEVTPWITLLELLRETLHLTGTKEGCGLGECGTCIVLVDGNPVNSCLMLAADANGQQITTIEGLASGEAPVASELHGERSCPVRVLFAGYDPFCQGTSRQKARGQ
jgi:aerobic-type carbon monoxide dehydrogenase small subunit (CoxS/CutS family)